ncbi:MAG: hypothetical protein LBL07_03785 [Tannerella sp.]|jgi:hypothetical protein|nr:hypothetical protein [Tannerella sp.]
MGKYQYTDKCANIYGGHKDREPICRKMVIAGVEFLDEHPNVHDGGESLRKVLVAASGGGFRECMGTLLLVSTIHARRAAKNGWSAYIREREQLGEERRKERD